MIEDRTTRENPTYTWDGNAPDSIAQPLGWTESVEGFSFQRRIGAGGMGTVYLALQHFPERRVALKLMAGDRFSPRFLSRFEEEFQVLAMMSHPNIAAIYDVGTTHAGRPFFTMEYVERGLPITTFCRRKRLGFEMRMELFLQVCRGVAHAHQRAVVHRDLKPANVLVTEGTDQARAMIIDFGIAKRMHEPNLRACQTIGHGLLGTPAYMSPEQVAGDPSVPVDTRADIYSLGVILFEMVTDERVFEPDIFNGLALDERLRIYREEEPGLASQRLLRRAEKDRTDASFLRQFAARVRGDLDAIILKAMAKDPQLRYGAVMELQSDIENMLAGRHISARTPNWWDRTVRYYRRNKLLVGAVVAVILALSLGLGLALRATHRARAALFEVDQINTFLNDALRSPQPTREGHDVRMVQVLAQMEQRLEERRNQGDMFEAKVRHTLGDTYLGLGLYPEAEKHLRRAVVIAENHAGVEATTLALYRNNLARALRRLHQYEEAEALAQNALDIQEKLLGRNDPDTLRTRTNLGIIHSNLGRFDEAEQSLEQVWREWNIRHGTDNEDAILVLISLADVAYRRTDWPLAEQRYALALERGMLMLGETHPSLLSASNNLAYCLRKQGRIEEAESLYRHTLDLRRRALGEDHPLVTSSLFGLGQCLLDREQYAEAEVILSAAYERHLALNSQARKDVLINVAALADCLWQQSKREEATALLQTWVDACREQQNTSGQALRIINNLACHYLELGAYAETVALLERVDAIPWEESARRSSSPLISRYYLARAYAGLNRPELADGLFCETWQEARDRFPGSDLEVEARLLYARGLMRRGYAGEADLLIQQTLVEADQPGREALALMVEEIIGLPAP